MIPLPPPPDIWIEVDPTREMRALLNAMDISAPIIRRREGNEMLYVYRVLGAHLGHGQFQQKVERLQNEKNVLVARMNLRDMRQERIRVVKVTRAALRPYLGALRPILRWQFTMIATAEHNLNLREIEAIL